MCRIHEAKERGDSEVVIWGGSKPMREFLHVDDFAAACLYVMQLDKQTYELNTEPMLSHINVGTGIDCTIREMAETIKKVVGFDGDPVFDTSKPDGSMRKLMDVSRLKAMGWQASVLFEDGLAATYQWYLEERL